MSGRRRTLGTNASRLIATIAKPVLLVPPEAPEGVAPVDEPAPVTGRLARRKAQYAAAISDASVWTDRVEQIRLAETAPRPAPVAV